MHDRLFGSLAHNPGAVILPSSMSLIFRALARVGGKKMAASLIDARTGKRNPISLNRTLGHSRSFKSVVICEIFPNATGCRGQCPSLRAKSLGDLPTGHPNTRSYRKPKTI